jgi:hypothetical protein
VVRITLSVHPWFGLEAMVLARRGDDEVHAELADGRRCYLPLAWTDRRPLAAPASSAGKPVRLTIPGLRSLAAWVADRAQSQKIDSTDRAAEKGTHGDDRRAAPATAVVGKAGASLAGRRHGGRGRKRGSR